MMRDDAGQTLLEILVVLAITTLAIVPLMQIAEFGLSAWEKTHTQATSQLEGNLKRSMLERWISAAYPFDLNRREGANEHPLSGKSNSIEFSAPIHPDPQKNTLYRITIAKSEEGNIEAHYRPDFMRTDTAPNPHTITLYSEVKEFEIQYLETISFENEAIWVDVWQEKPLLPKAIRLSISFKDDEIEWPPLLIPIEIEERAFCILNPISQRCESGRIPT
jgi:type II secretory pathway component PulJ